MLGGIVLVSSMTLFGALDASRDLQVNPRIPTVDDTTGAPRGDGGYILTPDDEQWIEASWRRRSEAAQRGACAAIRDGISHASYKTRAERCSTSPALGRRRAFPLSRPKLSPFCERATCKPRPNSAEGVGADLRVEPRMRRCDLRKSEDALDLLRRNEAQG